MRPLLPLALVVMGCQEFSIDKPVPVVDEPIDTDLPPILPDPPDIEVTPDQVNFGYLPQGCPAEPMEITIRNIGGSPLDLTDVSLTGPDAGMYVLHVTPRTLPPNQAVRATVEFTPPTLAVYNRVRLRVDSNDPDEPRVEVAMFGAGAESGVHEQAYIQTLASSVDVLFVIDNSGSMSDELNGLASAFHTFISSFVNLGMDYQIAVTTTDMDSSGAGNRGQFVGPIINPSTPDAVAEFSRQTTQGTSGSGDERGRDAAYAALTPPLITGVNQGFLRTDANLSVVVGSDEDESSRDVTPRYFNTWLNNLKGDPTRTSMSGMVGPDGSGLFGCGGGGSDASFAPRYHDVIRGTGGVWSNICQFQISPFLTFLSYVAAGLLFEFPLDYTPTSVGQVTVTVDGVDVPYSAFNGWTYDPTHNYITMNGTAVPQSGATIIITYPFQTSCL